MDYLQNATSTQENDFGFEISIENCIEAILVYFEKVYGTNFRIFGCSSLHRIMGNLRDLIEYLHNATSTHASDCRFKIRIENCIEAAICLGKCLRNQFFEFCL
jgi:hypothetical protein